MHNGVLERVVHHACAQREQLRLVVPGRSLLIRQLAAVRPLAVYLKHGTGCVGEGDGLAGIRAPLGLQGMLEERGGACED